jgi:hypothetical protein
MLSKGNTDCVRFGQVSSGFVRLRQVKSGYVN